MQVALLLSGGVDSSVALAELVRAGHDVRAFYLKVWLEDELDHLGQCPWEDDLASAGAVCERFGVPLSVVPLQIAYHEAVVQYTLTELRAGRTPSPDLFCNERIKFGAFLDYLLAHPDVDDDVAVATGHYAVIRARDAHVELARSPDPVKDQTYFLSHLAQHQLQRIIFPIGGMTKREVRELAGRLDLPNKERPDSQGICFLGKIRYPDFIRHYLGEREGAIVDSESGARLGTHRGFWFYTIGQRQGLGLGGGPWYVVGKDPESNTIIVSHAEAVDRSARVRFDVDELSWTWEPPATQDVTIKLRHGPHLHEARLAWHGDSRITVTMREPDRGVAPGQFAVFYDGDVCLGAGRIREDACTC